MTDRVLVVGSQVCARQLRDDGVEVVYLDDAGPDQVAQAAVQEDVEAVVTPDVDAVVGALRALGADDIDVQPLSGR